MRIPLGVWLTLAALGAAGSAHAERSDLLSCRQQLFNESPPTRRDYFIVVDRTVVLSAPLRERSIKLAEHPIRPGDHVEVLSFSGLSVTEFTELQLNMRFDVPATDAELDSKIPARLRTAAENCFNKQLPLGVSKIDKKLNELLGAPLKHARRSEILNSLTTISRDAIQPASTHDKLVLIVSDMLEFSDIASFYGPHGLHMPEPEKVLETARAAGTIGTFAGAHVYVQGAAAVSNPGAGRKLNERETLRAFWTLWFKQSGASLDGWGDPDFLGELP